MKLKKNILLPKISRILQEMGENIKLARLRRKLKAAQIAERANISRSTLYKIEKGDPSVSLGAVTQVLFTLSLEKDLLKIAGDDTFGRKLQDIGLVTKKRAPKNKHR